MTDCLSELEAFLQPDETAKAFLSRRNLHGLRTSIPFMDRLSFVESDVVEICGSSGCCKTELLIQAAVTCIMPRETNSVKYNGWQSCALFLDLDCRFDMLRFVQVLKSRIIHSVRKLNQDEFSPASTAITSNFNTDPNSLSTMDSEEVIKSCLSRFHLIRCSNSYEFLLSLKTLGDKINFLISNENLPCPKLLLIDNISAYYWLDCASRPAGSVCLQPERNRPLSLSLVSDAIVMQLRHLASLHGLLILATKHALFKKKESHPLLPAGNHTPSLLPMCQNPDPRQQSPIQSLLDFLPPDNRQVGFHSSNPELTPGIMNHLVIPFNDNDDNDDGDSDVDDKLYPYDFIKSNEKDKIVPCHYNPFETGGINLMMPSGTNRTLAFGNESIMMHGCNPALPHGRNPIAPHGRDWIVPHGRNGIMPHGRNPTLPHQYNPVLTRGTSGPLQDERRGIGKSNPLTFFNPSVHVNTKLDEEKEGNEEEGGEGGGEGEDEEVKEKEWRADMGFYKDFLPYSWQKLVTHRLLLQGPFVTETDDDDDNDEEEEGASQVKEVYFTAKWEWPNLNILDKFCIKNDFAHVLHQV